MEKTSSAMGIEPQDRYSRMDPFSPTETAIDGDLRLRIKDFYRTSDNPELNSRWLEFFMPDAKVKLGPHAAQMHENLRHLRAGMWSSVSERKHWVTSAIGEPTEQGVHVMLKGVVTRKGLDGSKIVLSWAGSAIWKKHEGEWRMVWYQVWLDQWDAIEGPLPAE